MPQPPSSKLRKACAALALCVALGAPQTSRAGAPAAADSVDLTAQQVNAIRIAPVGQREFPSEAFAVGSIDFDEDMEAPIFPPYQGKILQMFARSGDRVHRTEVLFTIDSPDLVQAESTLIADDATLHLTDRALAPAISTKPMAWPKRITTRQCPTSRARKARCVRHATASGFLARRTRRSTASPRPATSIPR
jgi:multidrug efflux pump subunit AcrA (membrane-fusion protein)